MVNKKHFFYFYFLNKDFLLNIKVNVFKSSTDVKKILMEGTVSPIFDLGLEGFFCLKKRETFGHFLNLDFLDFIKQTKA